MCIRDFNNRPLLSPNITTEPIKIDNALWQRFILKFAVTENEDTGIFKVFEFLSFLIKV